ncbi:hypothetical protein ACTXG7_14195 [Mycolicibacterium sp. Dal123E01]|uniref:hypothetical protein n=1 Tax=Mycolicibacterium sp. Dal123E01 TaxID=3457578 RepID=UPI00403E5812
MRKAITRQARIVLTDSKDRSSLAAKRSVASPSLITGCSNNNNNGNTTSSDAISTDNKVKPASEATRAANKRAKAERAHLDGQEASFNDFLGLLDTYPFWFHIVTP